MTRFPFYDDECEHGCATCKPRAMAVLNPAGAPTVFVGDGVSDRYASAAADVVFAKRSLADHCVHAGIAHVRYEHLGEVAARLDTHIRSGFAWAGAHVQARV